MGHMWNMLTLDYMQQLHKANHKCNYWLLSIEETFVFILFSAIHLFCSLIRCLHFVYLEIHNKWLMSNDAQLVYNANACSMQLFSILWYWFECVFVVVVDLVWVVFAINRAYPVYVNDYASGTQQQYYTTNDSYTTSSNHQNETYIVPVEDTLLSSQSRESPQTLSSVSVFLLRKFSDNKICMKWAITSFSLLCARIYFELNIFFLLNFPPEFCREMQWKWNSIKESLEIIFLVETLYKIQIFAQSPEQNKFETKC